MRSIFSASGLLLAGGIFSFLTASSVWAQTYPLSIMDDRKQTVVIAKQPKSVAAISVFGADVMQSLGRQAVGASTLNQSRTLFLGDSAQKMVNLGEVHETNMEVLTELNPDLIIGLRIYTEAHAKKFEEIGDFVAFDLIDYDDSLSAVARLTEALGEAAKGQQMNADFEKQIGEYHQQADGQLSTLFLWYWDESAYAFYDHHLVMDLAQRLKVKNLFGPSPTPEMKNPFAAPISMEKILQLNPQTIIVFKGGDAPISEHPIWPRLQAYQNNRVYRVADHYVMPHGPIARSMVLREIAHLYYPQQFAAPQDIPVAARAKPLVFK